MEWNILQSRTLEQVQNLFRAGSITEAELVRYIRAWNAGPHFTQAVYSGGAIRNYDAEHIANVIPAALLQRFGVRVVAKVAS